MTQQTGLQPLLDDVLPRFDVHEVHETWVPAPTDVVYAAVKQVTAREVRLLLPLEALRGLPGLLIGRRAFQPNPSTPLLDTFTVGVVPLDERPGTQIVAGAIGRFWRLARNDPAVIRTRGVLRLRQTRLREGSHRLHHFSRAERQPRNDRNTGCWKKPSSDASVPPLLAPDSSRKRGHTTELASGDPPPG